MARIAKLVVAAALAFALWRAHYSIAAGLRADLYPVALLVKKSVILGSALSRRQQVSILRSSGT